MNIICIFFLPFVIGFHYHHSSLIKQSTTLYAAKFIHEPNRHHNNSENKYPLSRPHYLVNRIVYTPTDQSVDNSNQQLSVRNISHFILPRA